VYLLKTTFGLVIVALLGTANFSAFRASRDSLGNSNSTSVAIVLDNSDSMRAKDQIDRKKLISSLSPLFQVDQSRRFFIISVSTVPKLVADGNLDGPASFTALEKLASRRGEGGTALYDACQLAIAKLAQQPDANKILLIISDGLDTMSHSTLASLKSALIDNRVKVYSVNVSLARAGRSWKGFEVLTELALISGGEAFQIAKSDESQTMGEAIVRKF